MIGYELYGKFLARCAKIKVTKQPHIARNPMMIDSEWIVIYQDRKYGRAVRYYTCFAWACLGAAELYKYHYLTNSESLI